jgi:hypothetical protein
MAITFVGNYAGVAGVNVGLTPLLPSGVESGDLLVAYFMGHGGGTIGIPSGWTAVSGSPFSHSGGALKIAIIYRVATGSDSAPAFTYTGGGADNLVLASTAAWRGTHASAPFGRVSSDSGEASAAQNIVYGGGNLAVNPTELLTIFGVKADDWTSIGVLSGNGFTWSQVLQHDSSGGNDGGVVWDYTVSSQSVTVADGSETFTVTGGVAADTLCFGIVWLPAVTELAGNATATATATGDLSTGNALAAAAAAQSTATGDLSTGIPLSGDATAQATASATLPGDFAAGAAAQATATASLSTRSFSAFSAGWRIAGLGETAATVTLEAAFADGLDIPIVAASLWTRPGGRLLHLRTPDSATQRAALLARLTNPVTVLLRHTYPIAGQIVTILGDFALDSVADYMPGLLLCKLSAAGVAGGARRELSGVHYQSAIGAEVRLRALFNPRLQPDDVLVVDGADYTVLEHVTYNQGTALIMEATCG